MEWEIISSFGFPIFVAVYLLIRLEPVMKDLQKTITVLTVVIAKSNDVDYEKTCKLVGKSSQH